MQLLRQVWGLWIVFNTLTNWGTKLKPQVMGVTPSYMGVQDAPAVIFRERSEAIITSHSWLLCLEISFLPHKTFLEQLSNATKSLQLGASKYFEVMQMLAERRLVENPVTTIIKHQINESSLIQKEVEFLELGVESLIDRYQRLAGIYLNLEADGKITVPKRVSLKDEQTANRRPRFFPVLLSLLSGGLSIATMVEVADIKEQVKELTVRTNDLLHSSQRTWMALKDTLQAVQRNSDHIAALQEHVDNIVTHVEYLINQLNQKFAEELLHRKMTTHIMSAIQLLQMSIQTAADNLQVFQTDLHNTLFGKLPATLLPREELRRAINEINLQLPGNNQLAVDFSSIEAYLQAVLMVGGRTSVYAALEIPVANVIRDQFTVYDIINHPYRNKQGQMVSVDLPSRGLAINTGLGTYQYLNSAEVTACGYPGVKVCVLNKPIFDLHTARNCEIGWFTKNKDMILEQCQETIMHPSNQIYADAIEENAYLLSTQIDIAFTQECHDDITDIPPDIHVPPGNHIIYVTEGCRAISNQITLPSQRQLHSEIKTDTFLIYQQLQWENMGFSNMTELSAEAQKVTIPKLGLPPPEGVPQQLWDDVNHWSSKMNQLKPLILKTSWIRIALYIMMAVIAILLLVLLIGGFVIYRKWGFIQQMAAKSGNLNLPEFNLTNLSSAVRTVAEKIVTNSNQPVNPRPAASAPLDPTSSIYPHIRPQGAEAETAPSPYPDWTRNTGRDTR